MKLKALKTIHNGPRVILPGCEFDLKNQKDIDFLIEHEAAVPVGKAEVPVNESGDSRNAAAGESGAAAQDKEDSGDGESEESEDGTEEEPEEESEAEADDSEPEVPVSETVPEIETQFDIPNVSADIEKVLIDAGYDTVEKIKAATIEELVALPKIGYAIGRRILDGANKK